MWLWSAVAFSEASKFHRWSVTTMMVMDPVTPSIRNLMRMSREALSDNKSLIEKLRGNVEQKQIRCSTVRWILSVSWNNIAPYLYRKDEEIHYQNYYPDQTFHFDQYFWSFLASNINLNNLLPSIRTCWSEQSFLTYIKSR